MLLSNKMSSVKNWLQVSACFIEYKGKILLLQRPQQHKFAGKWIEPGGKVDTGESHEQAMIREVFEEAGVRIGIGDSKKLGEKYFFFDNTYIAITFFHYTTNNLPSISLAMEEADKYTWISPIEALKLDLIDDLENIIQEFFIDVK